MPYNRSRFNNSRFNVGSVLIEREIEIGIVCYEELDAVIGSGTDRIMELNSSNTINGSVDLSALFRTQIISEEHINTGVITVYLVLSILHNVIENFERDIHASKIANFETDWTENIQSVPYVGKFLFVDSESFERINSSAYIGKFIPLEKDGWAIIDMAITVGGLIVDTIVIDVTLQPGQEITINSDLFTAWHGNNNILHLYHGEWIHLDRQVVGLELNAATGHIAGEIIYNERFL